MLRFFLLDTPIAVNARVDLAALAHQLRHVLRAAAGDHIVLLDGQGCAYLAEIVELDHKRAAAVILEPTYAGREPALQLTLYQAALKGDKMEWVLQKATELGVACIVPVISARTIARPAQAILRKYSRWQAILREAAEQCGRSRIPALVPPATWVEAVGQGQGLRLLPWEAAEQSEKLLSFVQGWLAQQPAPAAVSLLVGPEGGLTAGEAMTARQSGWALVGLGPRILRAETAAIVAASVIMAAAGELDGSPHVASPTATPV